MSISQFSLVGRTALVTGAGQGIGKALAIGLADAGAKIVASDVTADPPARVAEEIRRRGGDAMSCALDVSSPEAIDAFFERPMDGAGQIDILVNNAGIRDRSPGSFDTTVEEWDEVFAVNVRGLFLLSRAAARGMATRGHGAIVNIASQLGLVGMAGRPAYTASKGAVVNLTRSLALEWAVHGIRVNAVAIGPIRTPYTERFKDDPEANRRFEAATPLGPWHDPEEIVGSVVYLASAASKFTTGSVLVADGGYTAK